MEKSTKDLIKAVTAKRERLGLSLRKLADTIGISFSTLSRLERFDSIPDTNTMVRLVNWLQEDSAVSGQLFEKAAEVHFRAAKQIDSKTAASLVRAANLIKHKFRVET